MKIQVLGSGCSNCEQLFKLTKEAVKQLRLKVEVEYITDVAKIVEMGVMSSPVLAIDGKAAIVGFVPDIEKIKKLLSNGASAKQCECKEEHACSHGNCDCKCDDNSCDSESDCNCKTDEDDSCCCGGNC